MSWFQRYAERTLVLLKPDVFQRAKVGAILSRFEDKGLKMVGCKMVSPTKRETEIHYGSEHVGKPFYPRACRYLASGPVMCVVLEGRESVKTVRAMIGPTDPAKAPVGTIRGDYGLHWRRNLIHASDSVENANREIECWFNPEEIQSWKRTNEAYVVEEECAPIDFERDEDDFHPGHLEQTGISIDPLPMK